MHGNSSFVPLGTQAGWGREDRSPDLRHLQPPSHRHFSRIVRSGSLGVNSPAGSLLATWKAGCGTEALTVAGQWRSFTAFPSILAFAVIIGAAPSEQNLQHGNNFHVINIYKRNGAQCQNNFGHPDALRPISTILDLGENMVTPGRLELPTRSLGNCCSIHLSYGATLMLVRSSFGKLPIFLLFGPFGPWPPELRGHF